MLARLLAASGTALALLLMLSVPLSGAEPLPELAPPLPAEPLPPMVSAADFVSEAGFFARWRASHRRRANRDGYIETDRPSFTLSDSTVPKGWLQVETGYEYWNMKEAITSDFEFERNVNTVPNLIVRYGWRDWIEFRAEWDGVAMVNESVTDRPSGTKLFDDDYSVTANAKIGVKLQTTRGDRWIPKSALVTNLSLPTGDESDDVNPEVFYIYTWLLTEEISIGGTSGLYFNEFFSDPGISDFAQSVIMRYHFSPAFDMFYEFYWIIDDDDTMPVMDAGLRWRPLANFQLDWRIGTPIGNEPQLDGFFTGVGLSFRY